MISAALLLAGAAFWSAPAGDTIAGFQAAPASAPRIRIVPQAADEAIIDIEESKDGSRLLTHNRLYAPKLWDAKRQILLAVLEGHRENVWQVKFSPDGGRLLSVSADLLQIWGSARAKPIAQLAPPAGEKLTVAEFSPTGDRIAVGTDKGKVLLFDPTVPKEFKILGTHSKPVVGIAYAGTGKSILSHSMDQTARLWDVASLSGKWQLDKGMLWPKFSADSDWIVAAAADDKALLIDAKSGTIKQTLPHVVGSRGVSFFSGESENTGFTGNVAMGPIFVGEKGDQPLTAHGNGDIVVYEPGSAKELYRLKGHTQSLRELRVSNNRQFLGTYGNDEQLKIWDTVNRKEIPLKLESGSPMAGEFSPNDDVFWLAYNEGEIHRYDLSEGKSEKSTYGAVRRMSTGEVVGEGPTVFMTSGMIDKGQSYLNAHNFFIDASGNRPATVFYNTLGQVKLGPSGDFMKFSRYGKDEYQSGIVDIWNMKYRPGFDERREAIAFSPDGTSWAASLGNGKVQHVEIRTGKILKSWIFKEEDENSPAALAFHPNGKWVVTAGHNAGGVQIWDLETGQVIRAMDAWQGYDWQLDFSADGEHVVGNSSDEFRVYDTKTGKVVWSIKDEEIATRPDKFYLSQDGSRIGVQSFRGWTVYEVSTGKKILSEEGEYGEANFRGFSMDGSKALAARGALLRVLDISSGKVLLEMSHQSHPFFAAYVAGGSRIVSMDQMGGMSVWDPGQTSVSKLGTPTAKKLATLVCMADDSWLVYDEQGRYDASDPSAVTGAYFVLEWEGGLEAVGMPQLKGQFYEPQLLVKALGNSKEPVRDVPSLESLRLYPELGIAPVKGPMVVDVTAKERDNGGIGKLTFYLNGKQFYSKKGSSYLQMDLSNYESYLLPETHLPEGRGNLLTVTVSNESGDLVSPPTTIDVGVPKDLKAPEIKLHALFVGVGDYPGQSSDLNAPPSDATALEAAVKATAEKLLPGRVRTSVLTTDATEASDRPTRTNILKWFTDTAMTATSSDIVMVFFAGHGVSKIGDRSGYFFLTSEADPSEVSPAMATTATITGEDLREAMRLISANKQVVILDTCHSGAASDSLLASDRSVSGEYQRAWESLRDTTGTWLLAGSASDQLSYESSNVDHGMLTYSLLEAIDRGTADGLRQTPSGELFVDVERWLTYAANRVESLKTEVGLKGVQRPEFKRSTRGSSFDIGVLGKDQKGSLNLKPPKPIVIVGTFEQDEEDPAGLEPAIHSALKDVKGFKPWFDVPKHPNVYRAAGSYSIAGDTIKLRLFVQRFDASQSRKTIETVEIEGLKSRLSELAQKVRSELESKVAALEAAK